MNRGVITISESGTVSMPTDTVWMTMQEIADMYNVFGYYVRKAVKAVFKDGILKEQGVRRHVRKNVDAFKHRRQPRQRVYCTRRSHGRIAPLSYPCIPRH